MANKINFITGETYTLAELFSGERQIIIPDLQRDYCWGNPSNKKASGVKGELVTDFIDNLFAQYELKDKASLNLGLIYGYEVPADHIQLCDGQQRLTTLFLLLGMVNKYTGKFRQYLISDYEYKHDDKEPYLKYSIRESSLYFLSDLVCQFFISNNDKVSEIKTTDWYFADYNLDPSIQSMIAALGIIEEKLKGKSTEELIDFGDWLVNKLTFLYFDMETRKNGEETFVIINTTGEPLSATQNLKPLVLKADINKGIVDADKKWEEIETWFWKKRIVANGNDTAEAGFAEFLRWITIIHKSKQPDMEQNVKDILQGKGNCDFPYKEISVTELEKYWKAVDWLFSQALFDKTFLSPKVNNDVNKRRAIGQNDCFVLLPIIKFVSLHLEEISYDAQMRRNVRRIYEFFSNLIRIDNVAKAVNTLVMETLKVVDKLNPSGDLLALLNEPGKDESQQILRDEEIRKLEILRDSANREEVEELFWEVQNMYDGRLWLGEISPLLVWSTDGEFDFNRFKALKNLIDELFKEGGYHEPIVELLRRCMIVCIKDYKPVKRGWYTSFGWQWYDWHVLFNSDIDGAGNFFDYVLNNLNKDNNSDLQSIMERYIQDSLDSNKDYSEFAKDNYLLSFMSKGGCDMIFNANDWQLVVDGPDYHRYFLSKHNIYILREFGGDASNNLNSKIELSDSNWLIWYCPDGFSYRSCIVFENKELMLKIDARWAAESDELVLELKPTTADADNFQRIVGLLPEFVPEEEELKAIFKTKMEQFDAGQIKIIIEEFMRKIDELALVQ